MSAFVARIDGFGRTGWIMAMILGFIVFWPIGLAILFFMIWSGRMGCSENAAWNEHRQARWERKMERMQEKMDRWNAFRQRMWGQAASSFTPSGNRAFDEYRSETIRRLEEEAQEFKDFLDRLRHAKDKAEFEQFMEDRKNRPVEPRGENKPGGVIRP